MEVSIKETAIIQPSTPPFAQDHTLQLSHLDTDRNMNVTFRYLRVYVNNSSATATNHPFNVISAALSSALVHYYPLAGTLRRSSEDERLEVVCSGDQLGVPVINATVDCTLESVNYLDDPDYDFVERLVPDPSLEEGMVNPCVLQVTVFECGGFTLGAALRHVLCDGLGATQFFNVMAELARGADRISVEPVWDRMSLLSPREPARFDGPVREFLDLEKGSDPYGQTVGKVVRECYNVKDEWLDGFKNLLLEKSGSKFTTFEALGAFLWRAKVKAAELPGDEVVKYTYAMNIRRLIKPPLPLGYWGNGCVPMYAQLLAKELIEQPIWKTAEVIKKSKINATDEYVHSFIDFQAAHHADGITAGNRVSGFTDWRHLGHSTVDFGWGGPVTVLPLSRHLVGSTEPCFFLPYSSANVGEKDGFKVLVTLQESALPAFKKEMEKFSNQDFE
ncbi:spermidine sinapoyl-CoA acyltransferase [Mercurialis annua]|uniref:spermidine sinapoyl-CoA acyltransferase n=1 Tax=Mercurialis annua TaxID=3986 RepID=UPI00215EF07C|nr:spermidine sinapoyl-CoA acyltransferase [Mercurialis annua]